MALRGLHVFTHDSKLGTAPAHSLLESVRITRLNDVDVPRSFTDYDLETPDDLPTGVTLTTLVG